MIGRELQLTLRCDIPEVIRRGRVVLRAQQLKFPRGTTSLLGVNGAGKSTLFSTLLGTSQPTATCRLDDADRSSPGFMAQVGYLPQDVPAIPTVTLLEFVDHCAWLKGIEANRRRHAVGEVLDRVNLADSGRVRMSALSGGMRRRAGVAVALVHDPTLLILDEPTAGLDPLERTRLHGLIRDAAADKITIVATHLLEDVRAMGGEVRVLAGGQVGEASGVDDSLTDHELLARMEAA